MRKNRQGGALLIELVLTIPVLLAVIFAIVEYSVLLGALLIMNNTTGEAARQATVYRSGFTTSDYENLSQEALQDLLPAYVGTFRERVVPSVNSFACGDSVCLRLRLDYPNYSSNPIVGNSFFIPLPSNLSAESTTRVEPNDG
ncbi:TadE/TadG family type IV pilus assembly protein [Limnobacter parvus]|uniref:Pilus assembly protein n=1 Tax=Limnobacter parvus TaxID=2939690 RepID=A0ABT1XKL1_9BURK|nr:TadE family protein [Limnobacter parvus]MCR2747832.1 pilus assembly protein [Limnobacter parvus]